MSEHEIPYGQQWVSDEDVQAVEAVLRSDWLTTGPAVSAFEEGITGVTGGNAAAVLSSGTAALHAAYAAAGLGPGKELLTTPMTFVSTATAALHLGATVRFADVDDATGNIDPGAVRAEVHSETKVIAPVDFAGHPAEIDALADVARDADAVLVEDASHAIGARYCGRPVGSLADMTVFSFHPVKTITCAEGGAVVSTNASFIEKVRVFRSHGMVRSSSRLRNSAEGGWHQEVQLLGLNYRLPDVLAALGSSQLRRLGEFVSRRAKLVRRYKEHLADVDGLRLPVALNHVEPAWHLFVVRVPADIRRFLYEKLRDRRINAQVHYLPVYRHPLFQDLGYKLGACPRAEERYAESLSLPLFPRLTEAEQDRVIEVVREVMC